MESRRVQNTETGMGENCRQEVLQEDLTQCVFLCLFLGVKSGIVTKITKAEWGRSLSGTALGVENNAKRWEKNLQDTVESLQERFVCSKHFLSFF